jgi:hypothetical protein
MLIALISQGSVRAVHGLTDALALWLQPPDQLESQHDAIEMQVAWMSPPPTTVRAVIAVCRTWFDLGMVAGVILFHGVDLVNPVSTGTPDLDRFCASFAGALD